MIWVIKIKEKKERRKEGRICFSLLFVFCFVFDSKGESEA